MPEQRHIYLASSWRNKYQPALVQTLRHAGHAVYDFRNPTAGPARDGAPTIGTGFQWSEIDTHWPQWTTSDYRKALCHPRAQEGYRADLDAMRLSDTCVLLLPCGRSAHLEAGWCVGSGADLFILQLDQQEPELMYKMATALCLSIPELLAHLEYPPFRGPRPGVPGAI